MNPLNLNGLKMPDKSRVLVVVGPTAVGKTDLAIQLAKAVNGEIISADSRLFYRGMNIGTAKPSPEQLKEVRHHLIDVADPEEIWSLSVFCEKVKGCIQEIQSQKRVPILVGGTGQYIRAVIEGWEIPPQQPDDQMRLVLEKWGKKIGAEALYQKLLLLDPVAAEKIDRQNLRRTVRALEVIYLTGERFSVQRRKQTPAYDFWIIGLTRPRPELYTRIDERIEEMFTQGLVEEANSLLDRGLVADHPNLSAIGYREVIQFIQEKTSLKEAKTQMRRKTREFVRRQANWFKPEDPSIHWYEMGDRTLDKILDDLRVVNILR